MRFVNCFVRTQSSLVLACLLMVALSLFAEGPSLAQSLPQPKSEVLLTVSGEIGVTNAEGEARFDRDMLQALGVKSISTENPFQTGMHTFEGVLISDVLDAVQANGTALNAEGHDGYSVQIPIEDVRKFPVMLAMVWNGKVMRVRNKGPLWVIYPLTQYPELVDQKYSARSVWQLKQLTIE